MCVGQSGVVGAAPCVSSPSRPWHLLLRSYHSGFGCSLPLLLREGCMSAVNGRGRGGGGREARAVGKTPAARFLLARKAFFLSWPLRFSEKQV